jgi:hypothetical protein
MKSKKNGKDILIVEVQSISQTGIWLFVIDKEYFLPFKEFPWFKNAKVSDVQTVKLNHGHHLHWPKLDLDLELESIENPSKYPKLYK